MHTTNYFNTLIEIAEDCPSQEGQVPPLKGEKRSIANMQFDMIINNPYKYNSDEILYGIFAERKGLENQEIENQREIYFSKGQPCFRASPLPKRYGWGVHSDEEGKVAIYGKGTSEYEALVNDEQVKKVKAMRSKRK